MADLHADLRAEVDEAVTVDDLAECLQHLCRFAKRQQCVVGTAEYPTPWDRAHRRMDGPLDDLLAKRHA